MSQSIVTHNFSQYSLKQTNECSIKINELDKLWACLNKQVISYVYLGALEVTWFCVLERLHAAYVGDTPGVTCEEHLLNICLDL